MPLLLLCVPTCSHRNVSVGVDGWWKYEQLEDVSKEIK